MLKLLDADTVENAIDTKNPVITPSSCALPNRRLPNGPKMSGTDPVRILPSTFLRSIAGADVFEAEYFCNYVVNEEYEPRFGASGLRISARGPAGEPRAIELLGHRFFVGTLFQPQLTSAVEHPHPVIVAFLKACANFHAERSGKTS